MLARTTLGAEHSQSVWIEDGETMTALQVLPFAEISRRTIQHTSMALRVLRQRWFGDERISLLP